jgi:two-component system, cell cycle response regulator CpdR
MRVEIQPGCSSPRPALRRLHAVVADDDAGMRAVVAEALRLDGHQVEEAADGVELLFHVSRSFVTGARVAPIDLVVSEVEMPYCTGLEVLRKLRSGRRTTPVVLMSGRGGDALAASVADLGGKLLEKPFTFGELRTAVAEVLGLAPPRSRVAR